MIISVFPWGVMGEVIPVTPEFTYTGEYEKLMDTDGGWRIRFLTSGTLKFTGQKYVDIFAVGGGGGGMPVSTYTGDTYTQTVCGGGGGGGYTATETGVTLIAGHEYEITIGAGGAPGASGGTTSLDNIITAQGGQIVAGGNQAGNGGSGGGGGSRYKKYTSGSDEIYQGGNGGSNGSDGYGVINRGTGQGTTTAEFGETGSALYGGAGGGGNSINSTNYKGGSGGGGDGAVQYSNVSLRAVAGYKNTGGGGGGGTQNYGPASGGSGILIIRNARTQEE